MLKPTDVGLPYGEWYPGQWEIVTDLVASDKKIILLEAPTGSGKSGIVTAAANLLDARMLIATGTKQLQDQYAVGFPRSPINDVRGRGNFPCVIPINPGDMADRGPCTVGEFCGHKVTARHSYKLPMAPGAHDDCDPCQRALEPCPYYDQRFAGEMAQKAVLNYAYWLTMINYGGAFAHRGLTVLDEAHTLEDEIRRFATVRFSGRTAAILRVKPPPFNDNVADWQAWAREARAKVRPDYAQISTNRAGPVSDDREDRYRRAVMSFWRASEMFLLLPADSWVATHETINGVVAGSTVFKPVWVGPIAQVLVWRHLGEKTVLMSGTILDREIFCDQIGLDPAEVDFFQVPSSYDPKNRPLYYRPSPVKIKPDPETDKDLVEHIDMIIDQHPDESGIIHTVSHRLAHVITTRSRHSLRMIGHAREDKALQLDLFKRTPGAIWVSPSSGMGVDLPYDLCRWQVIAKLPFPDLGDKQIKQAMKIGPDGRPTPKASKWYNWQTLCSLMQMYGRGMRAPDDFCTSYLIDPNWKWFRSATRAITPNWFQVAIKTPRPLPIKQQSVGDFLKMLGVTGS